MALCNHRTAASPLPAAPSIEPNATRVSVDRKGASKDSVFNRTFQLFFTQRHSMYIVLLLALICCLSCVNRRFSAESSRSEPASIQASLKKAVLAVLVGSSLVLYSCGADDPSTGTHGEPRFAAEKSREGRLCDAAPTQGGEQACLFHLGPDRPDILIEATERLNELREAGVSDITGSCTLVQALALNRSALPDNMIRSLPYPGTGFTALPESLLKLRAAFTWTQFDQLYDYTWDARQQAFGTEMQSRSPIARLSDPADLQTGDLVIGGSSAPGVHMYMFLEWVDCDEGASPCTLARIIDNSQDDRHRNHRSPDGEITVDGRTGLEATKVVDVTKGIYTFVEAFRLPDRAEETSPDDN